jgi:NAD(P)-dependent dehydrogenase (short-subunit alcohol dehydrogenase family)
MRRFLGKTCIVTGGARGKGAAIATRLGIEGCAVAIFDIDEQAGEYRQRELEKNGIRAIFYKVDVASEEMVKQAVEEFYAKHGRLDILVNNAGVGFSGKSIEEQTLEEWRKIIDTNLTGT